ncbi:dihydrofolate reductase family protein [Brevibacterium sp. RIT 803]|uniref:dihydrofolate reductase family protein n=1 Tax=Brevibacterium sp. RIT 803 TaxID=2810210 RepID=UPI00195026CE|nr:dihydrofolate reductase family protein [Brevibacterium sp. RIT 803]MBM6591677.1 dihydrofolate reductase family protein [Brevibacterium sp. RIT 803]
MPQHRRLKYFVALSIDGFIAGPDGGDPSGWWPITEDYIDFIRTEYPETLPGPARDAMGITGPGLHFDTVIEGRRSFELGLAAGLPDAYPHLRHLVVSSTLGADPESAVEVVSDDPVGRIRDLKGEQGKDIWLVGGGTLASSVRSEIDELIIKLGPLTLGTGVPLWGSGSDFNTQTWTTSEVRAFPGGMTVLRFERAGDDRQTVVG